MPFLPINKQEMEARGWAAVDFIIVTGDSYVDHPSFGVAIISRVLEAKGYHIAILPQPDYKNADYSDFKQFGVPRLGFMVTSGNIDSMVANYTAAKRKRSDDAYTAGGISGKRPDRAVVVYSRIIKKIFPGSFLVIGGLEASLRRFAHYDYWSNTVLKSILFDSGADVLVYGMGEAQIVDIAKMLQHSKNIKKLHQINGICYSIPVNEYAPESLVELPSYEKVSENKKDYAVAARKALEEADPIRGRKIIQRHGDSFLVQNPPGKPLTQSQMDYIYSLPYERYYHPSYESAGGVPAVSEVEFSIIHNRGCFGACNFCSLAFHQGSVITVRSLESIVNEAINITANPRFKGYIHDVGGPTANFRLPSCDKQKKSGLCKNKKCLVPVICSRLKVSHTEYLNILDKISSLPKVKKVFIRSGIRFDYLMADKNKAFFHALVRRHVSGQLKVAPEHCVSQVLDKMGKPHIDVYKKFQDEFYKITKKVNKEQYLVPYLISSHPGSTIKDAIALSLFLMKEGIRPEQVQDFYPTPGTISTAMFYTGLDPYTLNKVYVPKTQKEKDAQRALLQYYEPKNLPVITESLRSAGREDLIPVFRKAAIRTAKKRNQRTSGKKGMKKNI